MRKTVHNRLKKKNKKQVYLTTFNETSANVTAGVALHICTKQQNTEIASSQTGEAKKKKKKEMKRKTAAVNGSNDQQTSVVLQPLVPTSSLWIRRPRTNGGKTVLLTSMYRISAGGADFHGPETAKSFPAGSEQKRGEKKKKKVVAVVAVVTCHPLVEDADGEVRSFK